MSDTVEYERETTRRRGAEAPTGKAPERSHKRSPASARKGRLQPPTKTVQLYSCAKFAGTMSVSIYSVYRLCRLGMPSVKAGCYRWIDPPAAYAWLAANDAPPGRR
jgi:hypothetical protein